MSISFGLRQKTAIRSSLTNFRW